MPKNAQKQDVYPFQNKTTTSYLQVKRLVNSMLGKKKILFVTILILASTFLTLYTVAAYNVSNSLIEYNGEIWWRRGSSGSLFPWPRELGMLDILTKVNEADLFIYKYLIKSWILVGLSILIWIINALYLVIQLDRHFNVSKRE